MNRKTKEQRRQIRHIKKMQRIKERKAKAENKASGLFMKRVVFAMILAALVFTIVMIIVFVRIGQEPSTLIENVFRFLSVEGGAMALIKSVKTVTKKQNGESETIQCENEPERSEEE